MMGTLGGVATSCAALLLFVGTLRDRPGVSLFVAFGLALRFHNGRARRILDRNAARQPWVTRSSKLRNRGRRDARTRRGRSWRANSRASRARRIDTRRMFAFARIRADEVRQRYGVDPNQVPDFIALRGDPSDKLPGAPKWQNALRSCCGGTARLIEVLEAGLFKTQAEMLRLYRLIATMDAKAPLPSLADQEPTWRSASTFARDWGLNQLADRLDGMA